REQWHDLALRDAGERVMLRRAMMASAPDPGAFPVYVGATATGFGDTAMTFAIPTPAVDAGDRLILHFATGRFGAGGVTVPPAGWIELAAGRESVIYGFYWRDAMEAAAASTVTVGINVNARMSPII